MENKKIDRRLFARIDPDVHKAAKIAAVQAEVSFEYWIEQAVREKLEREGEK